MGIGRDFIAGEIVAIRDSVDDTIQFIFGGHPDVAEMNKQCDAERFLVVSSKVLPGDRITCIGQDGLKYCFKRSEIYRASGWIYGRSGI